MSLIKVETFTLQLWPVKYRPRISKALPSKTGPQLGVFTTLGGVGVVQLTSMCNGSPSWNTYHKSARVKSYFVN